MVRSCKRVFYAILGSRKLTDEILNTTICLVEGSLNACPLTPVSDDPDSLGALPPNHFLLGQHSLLFPSLRFPILTLDAMPMRSRTQTQFSSVG